MPTLLDNVRHVLAPRPGERPVCLVCGRAVAPRDERMRLRGGVVVHRACATAGHASPPGRVRAPGLSTFLRPGPAADYPGGVTLKGPSKTIVVEPVERPAEQPEPEPSPSPEPRPEPEKTPA